MREFFKRNGKKLLRGLAAVGVIVAVSLVAYLILLAAGVIYHDDGMKFNRALIDAFTSSALGAVIFIAFQVVVTVLLCAIPGTNMAFILVAATIFSSPIKAFLLAECGVLLSSAAMYLTGRFGGYKLCEKLLGADDCAKAAELLRDKGSAYFMLMMLFPAFPDDALVMLAGVCKMKLVWFIPSVLIGRGIGVATIVFGLNVVPFASFGLYDWAVFVTVCAFWIIVAFYLAHKLNERLARRREGEKINREERAATVEATYTQEDGEANER